MTAVRRSPNKKTFSKTHSKLPIPCNWCAKKYRSSNAWAVHTCKELSKNVGTKCPACGDVFASSARMAMHVLKRECHIHEIQDLCEFCGVSFISKSHKMRHIEYECFAVKMTEIISDDGKDLFDHITSSELDEVFANEVLCV